MSRWAVGLAVLLAVLIVAAPAQTRIENSIRQLGAENARGYLQAFIDGLGADMNSGLYHTAALEDGMFHLQLQVVAMGVPVADADKVYAGLAPQPYTQSPVQTATILGEQGASVSDPNAQGTYRFPKGEIKVPILPYAAPQLELGNLFGTQVLFRYLVVSRRHDVPGMHLVGFGLRHSISRYVPTFPLDLSAGAFLQRMKLGEMLDVSAFNFGGQVSKSWFIFTLYCGVEYERSTAHLNYTGGPSGTTNVAIDLDGRKHLAVTGGLSIDLFILHLSADIGAGQMTVGSAAVGLGN